MTRCVAPTEQGRLQGANSSAQSIAQLIGPSIFTLAFAYFIKPGDFTLPGAPFILAAMMLIAAMLVAVRVLTTHAGGAGRGAGYAGGRKLSSERLG